MMTSSIGASGGVGEQQVSEWLYVWNGHYSCLPLCMSCPSIDQSENQALDLSQALDEPVEEVSWKVLWMICMMMKEMKMLLLIVILILFNHDDDDDDDDSSSNDDALHVSD